MEVIAGVCIVATTGGAISPLFWSDEVPETGDFPAGVSGVTDGLAKAVGVTPDTTFSETISISSWVGGLITGGSEGGRFRPEPIQVFTTLVEGTGVISAVALPVAVTV